MAFIVLASRRLTFACRTALSTTLRSVRRLQNNIASYSGNLKKFLDDTCKKLNDSWSVEETIIRQQADELESAIRTAYAIFGQHAFRKRDDDAYETRFNKAIFDIIVYYFASDGVRKKATTKKSSVKAAFETLSSDAAFLRSIELTTKSIQATSTRFRLWGQQLGKTLGMELVLPQIGQH